MSLLRHVRRPDQMVRQGLWHIRCDCGWVGTAPMSRESHVLTGPEVEAALEAAFVAHLPADERETYLLVDQRPEPATVQNLNGEWEEQMLPRGTFIMPLGLPCLLTSWSEERGVRFGNYLVPDTGETGRLPIGEVRTADARVFKLDAA